MTARNRAMVFAGIITLAAGQVLFTTLALMQYFCVIDFLQELPILIFIRILYFHRPDYCGTAINIGQSINGMTDQAFVLVNQEPFTVLRTFILNSVSLGLSFLWILACFGLMSGGAENKQSKPIRWPWIIITVVVCGVDLVATVTYANDSFHTRTLSDMMEYIGATVSGAGNLNVNTTWVAWAMVILYSRFVILFIINVFLIIVVVIYVSSKPGVETTSTVEAPAPRMTNQATTSTSDIDAHESPPSTTPTRIPRPGLSQSFQRMKDRLFNRQPSPVVARLEYSTNSLGPSPERSPKTQHAGLEKKRTVNFPENLLSLPQRLENLIAQQQRRLDKAVIDTGRKSPPRASQSLPHLESTSQDVRGRRGTATELQGQLPWAYIPASAHRMRDQLPPDEDLPPVPLPDYSAIPSFRKASVHRAASSLSSLTQKKDIKSQLPGPPLTQLDVLY